VPGAVGADAQHIPGERIGLGSQVCGLERDVYPPAPTVLADHGHVGPPGQGEKSLGAAFYGQTVIDPEGAYIAHPACGRLGRQERENACLASCRIGLQEAGHLFGAGNLPAQRQICLVFELDDEAVLLARCCTQHAFQQAGLDPACDVIRERRNGCFRLGNRILGDQYSAL